MVARIYKPTKSAMQSGRGKNNYWVLEYIPDTITDRDPLMGYMSASDTKQQLKLTFDTLKDVQDYTRDNHIDAVIIKPQERKVRRVTYADNFKYGRLTPWTH